MGPDPGAQIRWGIGACVLTLLVVAVPAFVPDPFFRTRAVATTLDNVEGIDPGTPVSFRGIVLGKVRSVDLDPASRTFRVRLSVRRDWQPSACTYVVAGAANPFTAPGIEIVALENADTGSPPACRTRMAANNCDVVPQVERGAMAFPACRRAPDLIASTTMAVNEAANVARSANQMAQRLQAMLGGAGGGGASMAQVADNATQTLAALNSLSSRLDTSFSPGRGDIALTLGNVRRMTGNMAQVDVRSVNGILQNANGVVGDNRANVGVLVDQAARSAAQTNQMLEGASASLVEATANLSQMTANLNTLTERLAADPTYAVRGQKYADPPGLEKGK